MLASGSKRPFLQLILNFVLQDYINLGESNGRFRIDLGHSCAIELKIHLPVKPNQN